MQTPAMKYKLRKSDPFIRPESDLCIILHRMMQEDILAILALGIIYVPVENREAFQSRFEGI
jgi:hypothetical protein